MPATRAGLISLTYHNGIIVTPLDQYPIAAIEYNLETPVYHDTYTLAFVFSFNVDDIELLDKAGLGLDFQRGLL